MLCTRLSRGEHRDGTKGGRAKGFGFQGRWGWPPGVPQPMKKQGKEKTGEVGTYGERSWDGSVLSKSPRGGPFHPPRWGKLYGKSLQGNALGISLRREKIQRIPYHRLPRTVVKSPSLEGFKRCVEIPLGDVVGGLDSAGLTVGLEVLVILKVLPNLNKSLVLSLWSALPPTKVAAVKAIGTRMRHLLSSISSFDEEILPCAHISSLTCLHWQEHWGISLCFPSLSPSHLGSPGAGKSETAMR